MYEKGDPVSSPSGENVITYRWTSGRFVQEYSTHNEYSNAVGGDASPPQQELTRSNRPLSEPDRSRLNRSGPLIRSFSERGRPSGRPLLENDPHED